MAGAQGVTQTSQSPRCRLDGRVVSAGAPLPGVSLVVRVGDVVKAATSSDLDGRYVILFAPGATYRMSVELTGFALVEREFTFGAPPCDQTVDFQLSLTRGQ